MFKLKDLLTFAILLTLVFTRHVTTEQVGVCEGQLKAHHRTMDGRNLTLSFVPTNFTSATSVTWWLGFGIHWNTLRSDDTKYSFRIEEKAFKMTINKVSTFINGSRYKVYTENLKCFSNELEISVEANPCGWVYPHKMQITQNTSVEINYEPSDLIRQQRSDFNTSWVLDMTGEGRRLTEVSDNDLYKIFQTENGSMSVIIQGMRTTLNGHYGVRCFDRLNQNETFTDTVSVFIPGNPKIGLLCNGSNEYIFSFLNENTTILCNVTAGRFPTKVDVSMDEQYFNTSHYKDMSYTYKAVIQITDRNKHSHNLTCTASYEGITVSDKKTLYVIVPAHKPVLQLNEMKGNRPINITCSAIGRQTPNLRILIGKDEISNLVQTEQFDNIRGMNTSLILMNFTKREWQSDSMTCCSEQSIVYIGYQRNVCSDAIEINYEYPPEIAFDYPDELELKTHEQRNITCNVKSHPKSNILWSTDGNILHQCNETSQCTLSVDANAIKGTRNSKRIFYCVAMNQIGSETRNVTVSIGRTQKESTSDNIETTTGPGLTVWLAGGIGAVVIVTGITTLLVCRKKRLRHNKSSRQSDDAVVPTDTMISSAPVYSQINKVKETNAETLEHDKKVDQLVYVDLDKMTLATSTVVKKHIHPDETTEYVDIDFSKTEKLTYSNPSLQEDGGEKTYMNTSEV